ncbi:MAG TPA: hypothetical protein VGO61_17925 [Steroidobacteraceae bacterium]|jgi:hypothetical protein|nr:hypothetical protein [Steroidobacteraceae bacterium]
MEPISLIELLAVVLCALALVPSMAHVMELPNKLPMTREAYLLVQRLYRGWNMSAFVVIGALIATFILVLSANEAAFAPALIGFLAMVATQVVFWVFTFPVNKATRNWTQVSDDWQLLRDRWEFSHAASALLNFIAVVSVTIAVLRA